MIIGRDGTHVQVRGQHVGAASLLPAYRPLSIKVLSDSETSSFTTEPLLLVRKPITVTEFCSLCRKVDLITFA